VVILAFHHFDPRTKTLSVYTHDPEGSTSISDDHVNAVFFESIGDLWAGTQNGLDKFDSATRTFKTYDQGRGMSGTVVSCILEDNRGILDEYKHGNFQLQCEVGAFLELHDCGWPKRSRWRPLREKVG